MTIKIIRETHDEDGNERVYEAFPPIAPERKQEMLDDGWDLEAFEQYWLTGELPDRWKGEQEDAGNLPNELLIDGFFAEPRHYFFGHGVDIWLHNTGSMYLHSFFRSKDAMKLSCLLYQMADRHTSLLTSHSFKTTFADELVRVKRLPNGRMALRVSQCQIMLTSTSARRLAGMLKAAAMAHDHHQLPEAA